MKRPRLAAPASLLPALILAAAGSGAAAPPPAPGPLRFAVSFPKETAPSPLDGRVLLIVSKDGSAEPRTQVGVGLKTQQIFGVDVERARPRERTRSSTRPSSATRCGAWPRFRRGVLRAGGPAPVRDLSPRGRPHGETADGPRRGPAVEQRARQSLQHAEEGRRSTARPRTIADRRSTRRSRPFPRPHTK